MRNEETNRQTRTEQSTVATMFARGAMDMVRNLGVSFEQASRSIAQFARTLRDVDRSFTEAATVIAERAAQNMERAASQRALVSRDADEARLTRVYARAARLRFEMTQRATPVRVSLDPPRERVRITHAMMETMHRYTDYSRLDLLNEPNTYMGRRILESHEDPITRDLVLELEAPSRRAEDWRITYGYCDSEGIFHLSSPSTLPPVTVPGPSEPLVLSPRRVSFDEEA